MTLQNHYYPSSGLNGKVWIIQYEGLRLICFKCGHLGHKEDACNVFRTHQRDNSESIINPDAANGIVLRKTESVSPPEVTEKYGNWMMVTRSGRKPFGKNKNNQDKRGPSKPGTNQLEHSSPGVAPQQLQEGSKAEGSRFGVLEQVETVASLQRAEPNRTVQLAEKLESSLGGPTGEAVNLGEISGNSSKQLGNHACIAAGEDSVMEINSPVNLGKSYVKERVGRDEGIDSGKIGKSSPSIPKNLYLPKIVPKGNPREARTPLGPQNRIHNRSDPKFKKGAPRHNSLAKSSALVGKENTGSLRGKLTVSPLTIGKGCEAPVPFANVADGLSHESSTHPNDSDLQDSSFVRVLHRHPDRGAFDDRSSPVSQSGPYHTGHVPSPGTQSSGHDDGVSDPVCYGWTNESTQGSFPEGSA